MNEEKRKHFFDGNIDQQKFLVYMVTFLKSFFVYPFNYATTLQPVVSNCGLGFRKSNQLKFYKKIHVQQTKKGIEKEEN